MARARAAGSLAWQAMAAQLSAGSSSSSAAAAGAGTGMGLLTGMLPAAWHAQATHTASRAAATLEVGRGSKTLGNHVIAC